MPLSQYDIENRLSLRCFSGKPDYKLQIKSHLHESKTPHSMARNKYINIKKNLGRNLGDRESLSKRIWVTFFPETPNSQALYLFLLDTEYFMKFVESSIFMKPSRKICRRISYACLLRIIDAFYKAIWAETVNFFMTGYEGSNRITLYIYHTFFNRINIKLNAYIIDINPLNIQGVHKVDAMILRSRSSAFIFVSAIKLYFPYPLFGLLIPLSAFEITFSFKCSSFATQRALRSFSVSCTDFSCGRISIASKHHHRYACDQSILTQN
ncbi:hypothetical protein ROZALSC1DRAFT_25534 [Rozella allomycis CSF55]|uniref:Uncharacterized protein n=1 Tax=Rozella allomycis (strain CSF55) TaxID=988480 RepID=A0A4P9YBJ2_ROZAC|nr:hypothetical protein ROZALSC1DRAFT_25534 [Rozella allomycis CSF55]